MTFWILATCLSVAGVAWMVWPLLRKPRAVPTRAEFDIAVYRDQLSEIDRDIARGILSETEGEATRTEVSRRLLTAADGAEIGAPNSTRRSGIVALVMAVALMGGTVALYLDLGAPGEPDNPLSARADEIRPSQAVAERTLDDAGTAPLFDPDTVEPEYAQMIEQLRNVLASRPDDLRGLRLLANALGRTGDFRAAYAAQAQVLELVDDAATAEDYGTYAELMILAVGGYVSPEAEQALASALKRDPKHPVARYYAGLTMAQTNDPRTAYAIWIELLREGPPDAPWVSAIRGQIAGVAQAAGLAVPDTVAAPPLRGPDAEDIAAAEDMSDEDRTDMIRGMVDRLGSRLATEGGTASEWAQLIRALGVLGEKERATAILEEARGVFAADQPSMAAINDAAKAAGLDE